MARSMTTPAAGAAAVWVPVGATRAAAASRAAWVGGRRTLPRCGGADVAAVADHGPSPGGRQPVAGHHDAPARPEAGPGRGRDVDRGRPQAQHDGDPGAGE